MCFADCRSGLLGTRDRVVVSGQSRLSGLYVVSAFALGLTALTFFRYWSVDVRWLSFAARDGGDDA